MKDGCKYVISRVYEYGGGSYYCCMKHPNIRCSGTASDKAKCPEWNK